MVRSESQERQLSSTIAGKVSQTGLLEAWQLSLVEEETKQVEIEVVRQADTLLAQSCKAFPTENLLASDFEAER